ncbi:unnamed protein product [Schistosoma turkestanicum]|nr:unnamed protein product [Schistosoma turkestanicum]
MVNSTRSHVESKITNLSTVFPPNYRSSMSSIRDNYPLSSSNSRRTSMNSTHVSLPRKQYGLPVFSPEMNSNSIDSTCDLKLSSLTDISSAVTNNELDEPQQFDFSIGGRHINSSHCKSASLQSYSSETPSSASIPTESDESISTSANFPLNINDNPLPFVSTPTNENTLVDRNRGRSRNRSNRSNSLSKNSFNNRDKCQTNSDTDQETLTFRDTTQKSTTSHSEHFSQSSKSLSIAASNRSENSNRRRDPVEVTDSSPKCQSYPFVSERTPSNTPTLQDPFQLNSGNQRMDSMLSAVYQQAAAMNLATCVIPVTAAALYSQLMLACSGSAIPPDIGSPNINLAI